MTEPRGVLRVGALTTVVGLVLVAGLAAVAGTAAADSPNCGSVTYSGSGTAADPYQVGNVEQLQCIGKDHGDAVDQIDALTSDYELVSDIDASGTSSWNGGAGFDPIGSGETSFTGTLDGQGHTISGLTVDRGSESGVGLFGRTDGTIRNLAVVEATVVGQRRVGGLAGAGAGTIDGVSTTGTISGGEAEVGGLVGESSATITQSYSRADVSADASSDEVGGLVGFNPGTVRRSFATGAVEGGGEVGGLVGDNDGLVEASYATGSVTGDGSVGGLVGLNNYNNDLRNSYAAAVVEGQREGSTGGLLGRPGSSSTTSGGLYWDTAQSGQGTSASGDPLTTAEMQGDAAESNMSSLDFASVWQTCPEAYPVLAYQDCPPVAPESPPETPPPERPEFEVVEWSVPDSVSAGESATVSATVANVGEADGEHTALLKDDTDLLGTAAAEIPEGERHTYNWTVTFDDQGTDRLFVGGYNIGAVEVTEPILDEESTAVVEASVPRSTVVEGESYRVLATVRNAGETTGELPIEYEANGSVVAVDRPVVEFGDTVRSGHTVTATEPGTVDWTVTGVEAGTVTVLPEAAERGAVDIYTTGEAVAPGEEYRVVPVVYNPGNETRHHTVALQRNGSVETLRMVEIPPGETMSVPLSVTATGEQAGTTVEWRVGDATVEATVTGD